MSEQQIEAHPEYWRKCNSCKKPIAYNHAYWVCNVSTCNRKRTGLVFCEVSCWDAHTAGANHRETWAEERRSPNIEQWKKTLAGEDEPVKKESAPVEPVAPKPAGGPKTIIRRK